MASSVDEESNSLEQNNENQLDNLTTNEGSIGEYTFSEAETVTQKNVSNTELVFEIGNSSGKVQLNTHLDELKNSSIDVIDSVMKPRNVFGFLPGKTPSLLSDSLKRTFFDSSSSRLAREAVASDLSSDFTSEANETGAIGLTKSSDLPVNTNPKEVAFVLAGFESSEPKSSNLPEEAKPNEVASVLTEFENSEPKSSNLPEEANLNEVASVSTGFENSESKLSNIPEEANPNEVASVLTGFENSESKLSNVPEGNLNEVESALTGYENSEPKPSNLPEYNPNEVAPVLSNIESSKPPTQSADGISKSELNLKSEPSSGYSSLSPTPTSSPTTSPPHTLKRSKSSTFRLIDRRVSTASITSQFSVNAEPEDKLASIIGWYPAFLMKIFFDLTISSAYMFVTSIPFIISTVWFSACLWLFWKSIQIPLSLIKIILTIVFVPPVERYRKKRTVLISGGSSVQAIHLARNFYSAGARVIVCEIEGNFGLARFSTAVHKYYTVPEPREEFIEIYINALKDIVQKENITYYIPVSETSPAYFDALAKNQLEALGCECFCPDIREVTFFDDAQEFMRKVHNEGTATPNHYLVENKADIDKLYDTGILRNNTHFMLNAGASSVKKRQRIQLPSSKRKFKLVEPLSELYPWLIIQDYPGTHFVTCTTIKGSRVVANVICKIDKFGDGLIPIECDKIDLWLKQFFANLSAYRNVNGHMSFVFAVASDSGSIVPLECQVGVRLPYICYTNVHPRIVWRPCRHFSRSTSGPIVANTGRYWIHEVFLKTFSHPSMEALRKFVGIIFDKKEALFSFWDPLPYCAFYYLQLPLNSISNKFQKGTRQLYLNS